MPLSGASSRHYTQFKPRGKSSRPPLGASARHYTQFIIHNSGILFIEPANAIYVGQPLTVNARRRIDIGPADAVMAGQTLVVNARRRITIDPANALYVGQELTVTSSAPPPVLRPHFRIRIDWPV